MSVICLLNTNIELISVNKTVVDAGQMRESSVKDNILFVREKANTSFQLLGKLKGNLSLTTTAKFSRVAL